MPLRSVLTYLQTEVDGHDFGTPIKFCPMPAPRTVSVQPEPCRLYVFPRMVHQERYTYGGTQGFRAFEYQPMDFTLRQIQDVLNLNWLPFSGLAEAIQAFLNTLGDLVPIPIQDPVTHNQTFIAKLNEAGNTGYAYAPVLRQDAPVIMQATLSAEMREQQQGPGE